jgi:GNAT superfamily N-acetyltransferase
MKLVRDAEQRYRIVNASRPASLEIRYRVNPPVTDDELNELFSSSWPSHTQSAFGPVLSRSLVYVCAYHAERLVGFVNLAWDGGAHAFLLDITVHPEQQRRGIGQRLVRRAADLAREHGIEWLHVDYEPRLRRFYEACGFRHTEAGLMDLKHGDAV